MTTTNPDHPPDQTTVGTTGPPQTETLFKLVDRIHQAFQLTGRERNQAMKRPPAAWRHTAGQPLVDAQVEINRACFEMNQTGSRSAAIVVGHIEKAMGDLAKAYLALLREPPEAVMNAIWTPTSEGMPLLGEWVLVVYAGVVQRQAARFEGDTWEWADESADSAPRDAVSHWTEMPKFDHERRRS